MAFLQFNMTHRQFYTSWENYLRCPFTHAWFHIYLKWCICVVVYSLNTVVSAFPSLWLQGWFWGNWKLWSTGILLQLGLFYESNCVIIDSDIPHVSCHIRGFGCGHISFLLASPLIFFQALVYRLATCAFNHN